MRRAGLLRWWVIAALAMASSGFGALAADSPPGSPPASAAETNAQDMLNSFLHLQEQLRATELALERSQKDAEQAAERASRALDERLRAIEESLTVQRAKELEAMQNANRAMENANRVMLIVAGAFAAVGFLALVVMAYFQWRTVSRLAEIAGLPALAGLGSASPLPQLGQGETHVVTVGPAEQSSARLLEALNQLQKRIEQLKDITPLPAKVGNVNGAESVAAGADAALGGEPISGAALTKLLLGKGESMLNLDNAEGALAAFDEILAFDSNHTEALLKKGMALERLRKFDDALACYDRAIAADASLTIGYLYKGGLYNRMERHTEALECYEKALHNQEAPHA